MHNAQLPVRTSRRTRARAGRDRFASSTGRRSEVVGILSNDQAAMRLAGALPGTKQTANGPT
jgi:hypothetical protein